MSSINCNNKYKLSQKSLVYAKPISFLSKGEHRFVTDRQTCNKSCGTYEILYWPNPKPRVNGAPYPRPVEHAILMIHLSEPHGKCLQGLQPPPPRPLSFLPQTYPILHLTSVNDSQHNYFKLCIINSKLTPISARYRESLSHYTFKTDCFHFLFQYTYINVSFLHSQIKDKF